jgi:L-ribulose-5-phosphate 4-epimerase
MLSSLKELVWRANLDLVRLHLVSLTFGNASGFDRKRGIVAIKPSGISFEEMKPVDIVLLDLEGKRVEGRLRPSTDTPSHLEIYRAFAGIGGVVHSHSDYATAFAQAGREIPCLGTTHADAFHGAVPVTRAMRPAEVRKDYELNTGRVIVERFRKLNPLEFPGVLVVSHGPFTWGKDAAEAVQTALLLEKIAKMALLTRLLGPPGISFPRSLLDKHFRRKHGPGAYYGQPRGGKR